MAVRTGEQFLQGLRDGREVWLEGERVADVTSHPKLTPRVSWFAAQRTWRRWLRFPMRFSPRSTTPYGPLSRKTASIASGSPFPPTSRD